MLPFPLVATVAKSVTHPRHTGETGGGVRQGEGAKSQESGKDESPQERQQQGKNNGKDRVPNLLGMVHSPGDARHSGK
jgi:hypothetical protein